MILRSLPEVVKNEFSNFLIIKLKKRLKDNEVRSIVDMLFQQNIEYCLFIGARYLILPILKELNTFFEFEWVGEEYCMISCTTTFDRYIPVARITPQAINGLKIDIAGLNILYFPKINNLRHILELMNTLNTPVDCDIIISCCTKYTGDYNSHPGWVQHEDHYLDQPGLHYFIKEGVSLRLREAEINYTEKDTFILFYICIPDVVSELETLLQV